MKRLTAARPGRTLRAVGGIAVLGPLMVDGDAAALPPRERVVLAALSVHRGETVRAEVLAMALWGDRQPATWTKALQGCLVQLRKVLGPQAIETQPNGYRLVVPADDIDALRFVRLLARARELLVLGEPDRAMYLADEALSLWRGPALVELDGWEPGRIEAERLEGLRHDAQEVRLEAALRAGRFREVLVEAQTRVADQPLREHRWALLALAQYQAGRQAEALRTIRQARQVLREELGLDPGPDLVTLEQAILRQDPSLVAAALPEPSTACPYLGLVPYGVADSDAFFGRDAELTDCLRRLATAGVLAVVGPSGSGKSSLVRAGIAAALERDGHRVVIITPGAHPLDALSALPTSGSRPVLVVDQCEEAVTLCPDADERARFFEILVEHAAITPLVVALRADRLGELSAHPSFADLIERGLYLLKRMGDTDLRAAIEGPARQAGLLVEPGLVDLMIRDAEGEPGALPLLSHALRQTWQRREGRTLTVAGYQVSGGIRGAVAQSAETVYEQAPPEQRPILRDLLLRLVAPSPEGEPVRARVPRRLVAADAEHEQVIEQLVRARLVTSDEEVVELAHESLARAWPRLRSWLDDDVEGQRVWRHLTTAADAWDAMGRPDSELYRGARLARAIEWQALTSPALNPTERAYLEMAQRRADAERLGARRRRQVLVTGLAAGLAVTTALAAVAFVSQRRSTEAAEEARGHELVASAVSVLADDPSLAKLLAVAAAEVSEPTVDMLSALHQAYAADRVIHRYAWPAEHEVRFLTTDLHPDGRRLVASGMYAAPSAHLEVYDVEAGAVVWAWDTGDPAIVIDRPFFTPDGTQVVAGVLWEPGDGRADDPPRDMLGALRWDADTGDLVGRVDLGACGGLVSAVSGSAVLAQTRPDGDAPACWAAKHGSPLAVELIDPAAGERRVLSADSWGREVAMSGDGRFVAVTEDTASGAVSVVLDLATGDRVFEIDPFAHQGQGDGVVRALSHDGSLLAVGYQPITIWDVAAGERTATFHGHAGDASSVFAPDGASVYSGGVDGALRHWDARSGREIAAYPAVGAGFWPSITADGRALVADPASRRATLIDTRPQAEMWSVDTCDGFVWAQTLGVAGDHAVLSVQCADGDHLTYVLDLAKREVTYTLPRQRSQSLVLSPDGSRFVRQEGDPPNGAPDQGAWHGPPRVRELPSGALVTEFDGVCTWDAADPAGREPPDQPGCHDFPDAPFWLANWTMTWSPDGSAVVVGAHESPAVMWDAESGTMLGSPDACERFAQWLIFSLDGEELLMSCAEGRLVAVSPESGEQLRTAQTTLPGGTSLALAGYTPDGEWLIGVGGAFFVGGVGSLHWIDPESLEIEHSMPRIHEGTPKSWALSPDRTRLATGASDGFVKVWDIVHRHLVHEIYIGNTQVQGLAFVGDQHLAVAPEAGSVLVYTLDADELLGLVRASLTRGFTSSECQRFNFDDHCPALDDLRQ
jgi:DNA-binding SARP family transcriptional activator/WD40 repeat protein